MAQEMNTEARRSFLLTGTRTAILATTRPGRAPHAVPIGFVLDGDDVVFLTNEHSVKGMAVQRDPKVTLVVDDETPPFAFVMIEGIAETSNRVADIDRFSPGIGERYGGPDGVEEFVQAAREELGLLVRVRPTKILALDRVAEH
jgi:PPOX class probable F420-dependent enzyme